MQAASRTYTPEERAALVEGYREWRGTQRQYADAVGVAQGTMSKWLAGLGKGTSPAVRRCAHPECRAPMGGRREGARFCSDLCRARWNKAREREGRLDVAGRGERDASVPAMLEVVPVATVAAAPVAHPGARLVLPGGAELHLDTLPPARWVAELAAELGRC
ncbi:MAG: hypothetical protein FJ087_22125 [Deltaproteobacteria bacterium]|nr:hypothetical protein [Deltaproteobacteria bacterium]